MMRQKKIRQLSLIIFALVALVSMGLANQVWGSKPAMIYQADLGLESLTSSVSSYLSPASDRGLFLTAQAYLVVDLDDGGEVLRRNTEEVLPIASVTKLVTAAVALDLLPKDQIITISQTAWATYGNSANLRLGQTLPLSVALYPLLLSSSNDLAEAIAEAAGRDLFLAEMNKLVSRLDMDQTFFADPSGLSFENVSTATDLAKLAIYLHQHQPEILAITRLDDYTYNNQTWRNLNVAAKSLNYLGGKNGYTDEAGRTLLSLFAVPINDASTVAPAEAKTKQERLLAVVLLASEGQKNDTSSLINYLSSYVYYLGAQNGFVPE